MKLFSRIYVKYFIKNPLIFYLFLCIGITLFLYMTLSLRLNVIKTYKAKVENYVIILETIESIETKKIYAYNNRNDHVYKIDIEKTNFENNMTFLHVSNEYSKILNSLPDTFNIDVIIGEQLLFERIFIKAGKG